VFETAQLGHKIDKEAYEAEVPDLQAALLQAQREIRAARVPVVIIVSGVEGSGKGEVVNRLHEWLDPRGLQTHAFWDETDEEAQRPRYWRFWKRLPPRGAVGIMFGSWYTRPIIDRAFERLDEAEYERELRRIEEFERLLTDDGALLVKLWFHLSKAEEKRRLEHDVSEGRLTPPLLKKFSKKYDRFVVCSERAIRMTDTGHCPWVVIEATNRRYRDLTVGRTVLHAMRERLLQLGASIEHVPATEPVPERERTIATEAMPEPAPVPQPVPAPAEPSGAPALVIAPAPKPSGEPAERLTVLDRMDLGVTLPEAEYEARLAKAQRRLGKLAWKAHASGRNTVAVLEGWDAAGKGGAIRRVARAVDARLFHTISIAAPTDEERAHHYLWRFWRHLPRAGYMTIYDRSWYGRVLVERVEGFARADEWQRAYQEINDFEEQLVEHGVVLLKFWLHISAEEQLQRFEERKLVERKRHKITEEDWRNRGKWDAYEAAVDEMVSRTSTTFAPWTLVAGNDKKHARIRVLETFCQRLDAALKHER
jgi:AMP-polyphosphate phosphotransferase